MKAFTLIELLIVVAIIAILAAIAIPNFLQAQVRAKVTRVQAEFSTCCTAIQCYQVDHNTYPEYNGQEQFLDTIPPTDGGPHFLPYTLTSPVPYISNLFFEIFQGENTPDGIPHIHEYHYFTKAQSPNFFLSRENAIFGSATNRAYMLFSNGPDLWCNGGLAYYDPTNGVTSSGDIMRFAP